jgi:hypothetical protein
VPPSRSWKRPLSRRFGKGTNVFALRYKDQHHQGTVARERAAADAVTGSPAVNPCGWTKEHAFTLSYLAPQNALEEGGAVECMQCLRPALT